MKIFQMGIHSLNRAHLKDKTPSFKTSLKTDFIEDCQNHASAFVSMEDMKLLVWSALHWVVGRHQWWLRVQRGLLQGELANPCSSAGRLWLQVQGESMQHDSGFVLCWLLVKHQRIEKRERNPRSTFFWPHVGRCLSYGWNHSRAVAMHSGEPGTTCWVFLATFLCRGGSGLAWGNGPTLGRMSVSVPDSLHDHVAR